MNDLTLGQRISECRKKLNISQEALGEKLGVSRQAISKWEADGAVPEIDKLIALSRLFGVSIGWLLGVEEEAAPAPAQSEISEELLRKIEGYQDASTILTQLVTDHPQFSVLSAKKGDIVTFGAYAKKCISNRLISLVRKNKSQKRKRGELKITSSVPSPDDVYLTKELGTKLLALAENSLSPYEKKIFVLYLDGKRASEISKHVGKSEKSVNNAIFRVKAKLKGIIG